MYIFLWYKDILVLFWFGTIFREIVLPVLILWKALGLGYCRQFARDVLKYIPSMSSVMLQLKATAWCLRCCVRLCYAIWALPNVLHHDMNVHLEKCTVLKLNP